MGFDRRGRRVILFISLDYLEMIYVHHHCLLRHKIHEQCSVFVRYRMALKFAKNAEFGNDEGMCVQFMDSKSLTQLAQEYAAEVPKDFEWKPHVFPRYPAPVIILRKGVREIVPMNYGLIPYFEVNEKPKMVFHNARSETIREKPSFKSSYLERRCLIPLNSFFEFVDGGEINPKTKKPKKTLLQFSAQEQPQLTAAGIWSLWKNPVSGEVSANFSMITRDPPEFILKAGHDRCPLFLKPDLLDEWLNPELKDAAKLDVLLSQGYQEFNWSSMKQQ